MNTSLLIVDDFAENAVSLRDAARGLTYPGQVVPFPAAIRSNVSIGTNRAPSVIAAIN